MVRLRPVIAVTLWSVLGLACSVGAQVSKAGIKYPIDKGTWHCKDSKLPVLGFDSGDWSFVPPEDEILRLQSAIVPKRIPYVCKGDKWIEDKAWEEMAEKASKAYQDRQQRANDIIHKLSRQILTRNALEKLEIEWSSLPSSDVNLALREQIAMQFAASPNSEGEPLRKAVLGIISSDSQTIDPASVDAHYRMSVLNKQLKQMLLDIAKK